MGAVTEIKADMHRGGPLIGSSGLQAPHYKGLERLGNTYQALPSGFHGDRLAWVFLHDYGTEHLIPCQQKVPSSQHSEF